MRRVFAADDVNRAVDDLRAHLHRRLADRGQRGAVGLRAGAQREGAQRARGEHRDGCGNP
jgi:hypothetical protein